MIKIQRKPTEKAKSALASLNEAKQRGSTYNTPEVNMALMEMFHGKCYICEDKEMTSCQIEHLIPHNNDLNLKYDWNNLFWSCAHCNNTKLGKYDPIIDCTKEEVDKIIAFRKTGYFGVDEVLSFEILQPSEQAYNTVKLLKEVYYGSTPQKKIEANTLRRKLRKELSGFKEYVREYQETEGEDKEDLRLLIKKELSDSSPFAAFKRWLIRDHKDYYPELMECFTLTE